MLKFSPKIQKKDRGYDYLLSMSIWTLTTERFEKLKKDASELRQRLDDYRKVTIDQIWLDDLAALEIAVNDFYDAAAKANAGRKVAFYNKKPKNLLKNDRKSRNDFLYKLLNNKLKSF